MCVHVHVCGCVHMCVHDMLIEALEQFWNAQRETEWFKMHPILSNPVTCTCTCGPIFCCVFGHWWKKEKAFCFALHWGCWSSNPFPNSLPWWWRGLTPTEIILCLYNCKPPFNQSIFLGYQIPPLHCWQHSGSQRNFWLSRCLDRSWAMWAPRRLLYGCWCVWPTLGQGKTWEDLRTLHWGVCCFERRSKIPSKMFETHYIGDVRVGLHVLQSKKPWRFDLHGLWPQCSAPWMFGQQCWLFARRLSAKQLDQTSGFSPITGTYRLAASHRFVTDTRSECKCNLKSSVVLIFRVLRGRFQYIVPIVVKLCALTGLMHVNVLSKALIELTQDDSIWPGDHQDERLRMAFVQFTSECKRHGVSDLVTRFTGHMVHMEVCAKDCGFVCQQTHTQETGDKSFQCYLAQVFWNVHFFLKWFSHIFRPEETGVSTGKG